MIARAALTLLLIAPWLGCGGVPPSESAPVEGEVLHESAMQREFSWVLEDRLAGMPRPGASGDLESDVRYLGEQQLSLLVSLTDPPTSPTALAEEGIELLHLPVEDFQPPTQEQLHRFVDAASRVMGSDGRVGVHCAAGKGRTGTFLAAYLVSKGMTADEAIAEIRRLRPGSVETEAQEDAVRQFEAQ